MTPRDTTPSRAVTPDHIVVLLPCPWEHFPSDEVEAAHLDTWHEGVQITAPTSEDAPGSVHFEGEDHVAATLWREPVMPEMAQLASASPEPLSPTEILLMEQHRSLIRAVFPAGQRLGRRAAKRASQWMMSMAEAGAHGAFLPATLQLHSPRFLRLQTMDLFDPQAVAMLFVSAWHEEGWMRSRGLTSFDLPELETPVDGGLNGAYFRIMDVAANMLMQMAPYPSDVDLQIGPSLCRLTQGPRGIERDDQIPINGRRGVQTITPTGA